MPVDGAIDDALAMMAVAERKYVDQMICLSNFKCQDFELEHFFGRRASAQTFHRRVYTLVILLNSRILLTDDRIVSF